MPDATFYTGLDLGQQQDYTALSVVEGSGGDEPAYALRHLERFELGTPYQTVARRTTEVQDRLPAGGPLLVDATGVGRPVLEMLKEAEAKRLTAITITGGDSVQAQGSREYRVPKRDLVATLQVLLQNGQLKFAEGLSEGETLRAELQNFKAKIDISTGHDSYEAWRAGDHDDLVLSLAMACWYAEYRRQRLARLPPEPKSRVYDPFRGGWQ